MKIVIVGTGSIGLVCGACFADKENMVVCTDIDCGKINDLQKGLIHSKENGLRELVLRNMNAGRLRFSSSMEECIQRADMVFCAVDTPADTDGSANLKNVMEVAHMFGRYIRKYTLFVIKSTVPVGTTIEVRKVINSELNVRGETIPYGVASNPEFLKRGEAVTDFMNPDRVVLGVENEQEGCCMRNLYEAFVGSKDDILICDNASAEMIKYASNCMLATRISYMNDIANLCSLVGADVDKVREGMGADKRIGKLFLKSGCGYGGSCLPKDVKALIKTGQRVMYRMQVLEAVEAVNERQRDFPFQKLKELVPELKNKTVAVWGLAFKPDTDDMRGAPSLVLIHSLLEEGCNIKVYDPEAMDEARRLLGDATVEYCENMYIALLEADALVVVTEWRDFRNPDWPTLSRLMKGRVIIDGRNLYKTQELMSAGFTYRRIG